MEANKTAALPAAMYVNFLRASHDRAEVRLAFGQLVEQGRNALLIASLVTTPAHAKAIAQVLATAVEQYEASYGKLPDPEPPASGPRSEARPRPAPSAGPTAAQNR